MKYFIFAYLVLSGFNVSAAMVGLSKTHESTVREDITDYSAHELADRHQLETVNEDSIDFGMTQRIDEATRNFHRHDFSLENIGSENEETTQNAANNARQSRGSGWNQPAGISTEPPVWAASLPFEVALPAVDIFVSNAANRQASGQSFQIIPEPQSAFLVVVGFALATLRRSRRASL